MYLLKVRRYCQLVSSEYILHAEIDKTWLAAMVVG